MHVTLEVPEDLARLLGENTGVGRAALEGLALEGVRSGKLSIAQARRLLGIETRYQMDGFLKAHGILLETTRADVERDAGTALAFQTK